MNAYHSLQQLSCKAKEDDLSCMQHGSSRCVSQTLDVKADCYTSELVYRVQQVGIGARELLNVSPERIWQRSGASARDYPCPHTQYHTR